MKLHRKELCVWNYTFARLKRMVRDREFDLELQSVWIDLNTNIHIPLAICHCMRTSEKKCSHRIAVIITNWTNLRNQESECRRFFGFCIIRPFSLSLCMQKVETPTMDLNSGEPRAHIRAPSLKRGKSDNGLNERVSFKVFFFRLLSCNSSLVVIQFISNLCSIFKFSMWFISNTVHVNWARINLNN